MDINKINLKISTINFISLDDEEIINILWASDIGFGNYAIIKKPNGEILGDSEFMDSNEDKQFIEKLLNLIKEKINIDISKINII